MRSILPRTIDRIVEVWLSSPVGKGEATRPVSSAVRSVSCNLRHRSHSQSGKELLDIVELSTPLCQSGGGDHGVAPGSLLRVDRPPSHRIDRPADEAWFQEHVVASHGLSRETR
jgi:hypothetical protein